MFLFMHLRVTAWSYITECSVTATDLDESELVVDYIWMNGNTVLDIERGHP